MELQPDDERRLSLGIDLVLDNAVGPRREFVKRFTKEIGKRAGNMPGDRQKKTGRLTVRMSDDARLAGRFRQVNHQ
ncbi:hypothetical protein GW17_00059464 [Ensete ventricosum]|nr:hypothetical protein GW17_00059464 [Ensete ventricosum]RZS13082.1 hypothetical protein BHM03_00044609 [Ensete ventricosum]